MNLVLKYYLHKRITLKFNCFFFIIMMFSKHLNKRKEERYIIDKKRKVSS